MQKNKKPSEKKEPYVKWSALGGLEEVGRNMGFLEYKDEIIIIDAGLQFAEEDTPGIDYMIPNTSYFKGRENNVKALVITHGHYDHIGAIPHILHKIGNPPIYATKLTKEIISKRQLDFPDTVTPSFQLVQPGEKHKLSKNFSVEFFEVAHNIPESMSVAIQTPIGNVVHTGDFKIGYDKEGNPQNMDMWEKLGKEGVHTIMLDSTNAETPGRSTPEHVVINEIEKLIRGAEGRVIISTFASLLDRLGEVIYLAEKLGKKVAISGYTMESNLEIAKNLGYLKFKKDTIISLKQIDKYKDSEIIVLSTGAQGEPQSSLSRIANGEHKHLVLKSTDTVIFSSSIVPGNERSVQALKDNLARQCTNVYTSQTLDLHSSGHSPAEELKEVMKLVKPKHVLPVHGYYFMRMRNAKHAQEALGLTPDETILVDNGQVVELYPNSAEISKSKVPASYVTVDGLGVGDVGQVVLRDRQALMESGMVVVISVVDAQTGKVKGNPDIISRGFVYLRESRSLLTEIRKRTKATVEHATAQSKQTSSVNWDYVKDNIENQLNRFIFKKTKRAPMILPVVIVI